jgi:hypothetical protein
MKVLSLLDGLFALLQLSTRVNAIKKRFQTDGKRYLVARCPLSAGNGKVCRNY